ncbi:ABC transporter ATP-binding protein [Geodermatophilus sp. URMC 64]
MTATSAAPAGGPAGPVLDVSDLTVEVHTEDVRAEVISGVSFSIGRGETLGLVGESGSGKSLTSMAIMGLLPKRTFTVTGGRVSLGGDDLTRLGRKELASVRGSRMAMIFQEPMTSLNPAFTVGQQIAETLVRHKKVSKREARRLTVTALSDVGISAAERRVHAYPHEFSGGMRQRVMIAMALCCEPELLIADEPTTALDVTIQAQVLDLIRHLRETVGMSILFVTHDLGVVADICDRVVVMYAGQVVEQSSVDRLFAHPVHPYTAALLRSTPTNDAAGDGRGHLHSIPGKPPAAGEFPHGCRFAPRCELALPECSAQEIELLPVVDQLSRCVRVGATAERREVPA